MVLVPKGDIPLRQVSLGKRPPRPAGTGTGGRFQADPLCAGQDPWAEIGVILVRTQFE